MKSLSIIALGVLSLSMGMAHAQSSTTAATNKPAASAKSAPAAKKVVAKKHVTKKGVPAKTAKAVETETPVQSLSDRLTDDELAIAKTIQTGEIPCELGAHVTVTADEKNPGFFRVSSGKQHYYMHPVESRTGAVRMEDNRAGAMWLQLGNKSMLMNQKLGQRIADECTTPEQREVAAQLKLRPQPTLFDEPKR